MILVTQIIAPIHDNSDNLDLDSLEYSTLKYIDLDSKFF